MERGRGLADLARNVLAAWLVAAAVALAVAALLALADREPLAPHAALPLTHWSHRAPAGDAPDGDEPDPTRAAPPPGFLDERVPPSLVVTRATE
jgi:hypothetical protein